MRNDVALVSMPFGPLFSPSLGLSLLKAALTRDGVAARVHYFTVAFAEILGSRFYTGVSRGLRPQLDHLTGDWIFSRALFDEEGDTPAYLGSLTAVKRTRTSISGSVISPALVKNLLQARDLAGPFLDRCAAELLETHPRIVGFTSVFQQHVASLALARRLKAADPSIFIVFGGANCEGIMGAETVRQFSFVDAALSGEGDLAFPPMVRRILDGDPVDGLQGLRTRTSVDADFASGSFDNAPSVVDMDSLPLPDCDDFVERFRASRFDRRWFPRIFFETSRGCWWGEKSHCTFCGLNGATMKFRSKSAGRALGEIEFLARRHPGAAFEATDNILDLHYFDTLLPALAERSLDLGVFWETKSNLRKDQVRKLRESGVRFIQPGIESLSDEVLRLMGKGVTALHNIQLLKWCKELGVEPSWNVLWGFPGEPPEEYESMRRLVPLLTHLRPPGAFSTIRLDRFSPNFFDARRLGLADIQPLEAYGEVYPLAPEAVTNLAYHFTFGYQEPRTVASYAAPLARALRTWSRTAGKSDFFFADTGSHLVMADLRPARRAPLHVLGGAERDVYLACDAVTDERTVAAGLSIEPRRLDGLLAGMISRGLMLRSGRRLLALAVRMGSYVPTAEVSAAFFQSLARFAEPTRGGIVVPLTASPQRGRARRLPGMNSRSLTESRFRVERDRLIISQ